MNYNEFEMIMNKLNVSFLALDLYSDYFSQDFYEESGIYMILDNNVDLLTLFFRKNYSILYIVKLFGNNSLPDNNANLKCISPHNKINQSKSVLCNTQKNHEYILIKSRVLQLFAIYLL